MDERVGRMGWQHNYILCYWGWLLSSCKRAYAVFFSIRDFGFSLSSLGFSLLLFAA